MSGNNRYNLPLVFFYLVPSGIDSVRELNMRLRRPESLDDLDSPLSPEVEPKLIRLLLRRLRLSSPGIGSGTIASSLVPNFISWLARSLPDTYWKKQDTYGYCRLPQFQMTFDGLP